ncbi:hypothetical protein [Labrenzia sp. PHM005]|nr:hypothetical protein [Labrenzia sp. PHM005]
MFDRSGEMKLSSLGLLLILTACLMTLFAQPSSERVPAGKISIGHYGFAK